jgi:hypothetical protein
MPWDNDDAFEIDAEREFAMLEDVPVFGYAELPDASTSARPVVTLVSPAAGTPLHPTDSVVFDVTDDGNFSLVSFRLRFVASGEREAVYDRDDPAGAWDPRYASSSIATITGGYRITLRRSGGWPGGGIGLLPRVVDAVGLVAT